MDSGDCKSDPHSLATEHRPVTVSTPVDREHKDKCKYGLAYDTLYSVNVTVYLC